MTLRHLAAAALACGALFSTSAPASATCYVASIDICDLPTDPYTDPVVDDVFDTLQQPVFDPVWQAYLDALCFIDHYPHCS